MEGNLNKNTYYHGSGYDGEGEGGNWGDLSLLKGECGPMWSQPICQHQALSEPPPARTVEMNWCMPRAYLPLGC